MTTASQYRFYAEECLRWAEETDNEEHRQAFLDMAVALATRRGSRRVGSEARDTDPDAGSIVFPAACQSPPASSLTIR